MPLRTTLIALILLFTAASAGIAENINSPSSGGDAAISLKQALDIAFLNNLDLKQTVTEKLISIKKITEAKSADRFTLKLNASYAQQVGGSTVEFQLPVYSPGILLDGTTGAPANYILLNPLTNATSTAVIANGVPTIMTIPMAQKTQKSSTIVIEKPIWTFGKIEGNIKLKKKELETSDLNIEVTKLKVEQEVKEAYYNFLLAQEFLEVTNGTVEQAQAHYLAAQARFDNGATPKFDVITALKDKASAEESLLGAKKNVELARMALNKAMGVEITAPTTVEIPESQPELTMPLDELIKITLKKRPEFKQLRLGQDMAQIGSKLAKNTPAIGFQGTYNLKSEGSSFGQQDTWMLGVGGNMTIFDGGKALSQTQQAQLTKLKLEQQEEQVAKLLTLQVSSAQLSMQEAKARIGTSAAILDQAKEAVRMAELGYKEGVTTNIDVIDAQHGLNQAKLNNAMARFDYEIAKAKLLNAVGVSSLDELEK